ncbi:hypothetical protein Tco_0908213 [Tanacetum coccineum]|uniref:Uncharacterized protein n=1 Tax=Tanacetum coccineum TaxID=301880 RepID=A0ABQ5CMA0_9ASTR
MIASEEKNCSECDFYQSSNFSLAAPLNTLSSPQWKYLVHVLLHCLSPKSTSWEQFGTNIASALVGLATNQKFNFSLMILTGMLGHISKGTPLLMYPKTPSYLEVSQPWQRRATSTKSLILGCKFQQGCSSTPTQSALILKVLHILKCLLHSQRTAQYNVLLPSMILLTLKGLLNYKGLLTSKVRLNLMMLLLFLNLPMIILPQIFKHLRNEGLLDIYALNREVRRLKKQTLSQAKQILKLKAKLKKLSKFVKPVVKYHALWFQEDDLAILSLMIPADQDQLLLLFGRKSDETEEVTIEGEKASNEEAGPSSPLRPIQVMDSEEQHNAAEVLVSISRPRGLSIPGPIQTHPQQPTQGADPKDKGKGILVEEPKKKKLTLQQIRALETTNDEEVARKIQAEWDAEEERKRFEELKKTKPKTTLRKPTSLAQERNQMMKKERENVEGKRKQKDLRKRKATISEEQPSKKPKLRTETIDELRNYLRVVDFEKNAQDKESLEGISMITELQVIDSPDGEEISSIKRVDDKDAGNGKEVEDQGTITPRILNFEEEAGPSSPLRQSQVMEPEEQLKAAEVLVSISRPRGLSIPGPIQTQTQPQQPTQGTDPITNTAFKTKQTDAEQRRPTIKKLEVKQVEFKLGEDCWEIQVKRSKFCHEKVKVLLNERSKYC